MTELMEKLDALDAKANEAQALRLELRKSLLLRELWQEAFEKGSITTWAAGNANDEITFTIKRADDSTREFDLLDVPVELWTDDVKDHIRRWRGKYWRVLREVE